MAARDIAGCMQNVRTMLGGLSAWRTICGVDNATEATDRIYYGGVEENEEVDGTLAPCIILDVETNEGFWNGGTLIGPLVVELRIFIVCPNENQETFGDRYLWVWQQASAIEAGINSNIRDGGQLAVDDVAYPNKPAQVDPDDNNGRDEWLIHMHIRIGLV